MTYIVELHLFRGADIRPFARESIQVESDTALNACVRAEELTNVTVADNEYAAAMKAVPHPSPKPIIHFNMPVAA